MCANEKTEGFQVFAEAMREGESEDRRKADAMLA